MLQVRRNGLESRGEFLTIVAIAAPCVGADPLARVHLKCRGACAHHLTALASAIAGRTDRIESTSRGRECWIAGQRSLPCGLACCIDIKDKVAMALSVPQTTNGF